MVAHRNEVETWLFQIEFSGQEAIDQTCFRLGRNALYYERNCALPELFVGPLKDGISQLALRVALFRRQLGSAFGRVVASVSRGFRLLVVTKSLLVGAHHLGLHNISCALLDERESIRTLRE